ncbi:hypothetical protein lacNasYZ03_17870 [Lactobacillus nasalidis]|uniref:RNase H type-1 domain-containing protein n=1 Tax=Lactobacillus nasalidis TaxID=2797258 RepID=A0ABQ3W9S5_9LACO|nr:ribonuclease H family protein [Lactobacillus nasalidis]GHV96823.1 hypothetical protein lacNasYZ01_00050 [Lactobacillus nasalidis]GHV98593.1 hypothetical protein lacNasYZ02_00230 [Lactobacillus nasalidis]GHW02100.1 hypothetical protein lacNasYZ03_17870 [Lactobacillus nasalidis]
MDHYNYYAYKTYEREGIAESWDECEEATSGVSSAVLKGFFTREDAEEFLNSKYTNPDSAEYSKFDTVVYTVGGSRKDGGRAKVDANTVCGSAYLIENKNKEINHREIKPDRGKTNNLMEITAVRDALKNLLEQNLNTGKILFVVDSKYALHTSDSTWFAQERWNDTHRWEKNSEVWKEIKTLIDNSNWDITWKWVSNNSGEEGNMEIDKELKQKLDELEAKERTK